MRMLPAVFEQSSRLHQLMARVMYRSGLMMHPADQGKLVGMARRARKDLGNFDAGNIGADRAERPANLRWRIGLHVERVELRRSAHQHQKDTTGRGGRRCRGCGRVAQAEGRKGPGAQKIPPSKPGNSTNHQICLPANRFYHSVAASRSWGTVVILENPSPAAGATNLLAMFKITSSGTMRPRSRFLRMHSFTGTSKNTASTAAPDSPAILK